MPSAKIHESVAKEFNKNLTYDDTLLRLGAIAPDCWRNVKVFGSENKNLSHFWNYKDENKRYNYDYFYLKYYNHIEEPFYLKYRKKIEDEYIESYYEIRLKELKVDELIEIFKEKFGNNIILLCHEPVDEFCHRRLLADYIELKTGVYIPEVNISEN